MISGFTSYRKHNIIPCHVVAYNILRSGEVIVVFWNMDDIFIRQLADFTW